ncbi:MAG: tetratricopeptide repeat protein [Candidatus Omnitrophica bacterium]|nr:tetratricopeptide repeat protein [Candidatus Omnitrophota bacterium]
MTISARIQIWLSKPTNAVLLLTLSGLLAYINCLHNAMFWDDNDFILNNIYIQDWKYWPHFFTDNILAGTHLLSNYWRPLLQAIFAVEWHLWADWVTGWHIMSVIFHIADGVLIFILLKRLFQDHWLALFTALVFILHPLQTETVVYANSFGDSLCLFFMLAGLVFFVNRRNSAGYLASLACFALGLMSKELGIILPLLILLCDGILLKRDALGANRYRALLTDLLPFLAIAITYAILRATILRFTTTFNYYPDDPEFMNNILVRAGAFFQTVPAYIGLMFWPATLQYDRHLEIPRIFWTPEIISGGLIIAGLLLLIWTLRRKEPAIAFGLTWFLITLLPYSNIFVIVNGRIFEHFLYIPLIGVGMAIAGTMRMLTRQRPHLKWPLGIAVVLILLALGIRTTWRNTDWRTAIRFYEQIVLVEPHNYRAMNNLGMEYADKKRLAQAETAYRNAMSIDPTNAVAYHNLGNLLKDTSRKDEAIQMFERAIALQPNFVFSYKSLARLYLERKNYARTRQLLEIFYNLSDEKLPTLDTLIRIAIVDGKLAEAKRYLKELLRIDPQNTLAQNLFNKLSTQ